MASESSSSSTLMSQDLGLDPSDPLNLLLHNRSQQDGTDTDTDSTSTPPDWSTLSNMWPPVDDSKIDFNMDFGLMDMSFDPAVCIEPNALNYTYTTTPDPFPFTFGSSHTSSRSSSESGSTSGSFSPLAAYSPPSSEFDDDPATELASRVRRSAGVMLAVQITPEQRQQQQEQQRQQQQQQVLPSLQQHQKPAHISTPVFTTTPVSASMLANNPASTATHTRPKTSHTTIERRYRTNLNARIQSLRAAVPALRVVDRATAIKAGEPVDDDDPEDIVDARGYVDGVKVARKCSKANVLGKAVEYIRVLKNREARLTRELAGLKTLLGGLVGGRELLREWEREWTTRFGGAETDEVNESIVPVDDDADDDEDESDEDGAGRKRKKPKVDVKLKPERKAAPPQADGEKKKRGRPRKVVPLPPAALAPALSTSVPMQEPPKRQYLLSAFALFSFFANANVSVVAPAHHAHEGHVLTRAPVRVESVGLLQIFHFLVSVAVLASVLLPVGKSLYSRLRGSASVPSGKVAQASLSPSSEDETDADTDFSLSSDEAATTPVCAAPYLAAAEACILDDSIPLLTRLHTALRLYNTGTSPDDRRLLALLLHPVPLLGGCFAQRLWGAGMGLGVDEAARRIAGGQDESRKERGVLRALEEGVVAERLRAVCARAFVQEVLDAGVGDTKVTKCILDSARTLGGRVGMLGSRVGRVLGGGTLDMELGAEDDDEEAKHDVEKLLRAIVLYRRVFGAGTTSATVQDTQALRHTLGSSDVFEDVLVEEARDRVVDLLTGQQ
ncbi:hypothetical protein GGX14DRAFT_482126 [Mycena pura]|uniref:BHLH domain-containing protein n=1 Tax=Mycena pura TaxID=153505 RepID=A0AAD6XX06_9AGAR|nr:hypothetical protein GGX14DRAFT_482126 [Mycena pura]